MSRIVQNIITFFERQTFGVCAWWGEKLRIPSANIRLFFIYVSFLTFGSPLVLYLIMAFFMKLRETFGNHRSSVWDL